MDNQTFDACMEKIRQGDQNALKDIYEAYASYLYHLILTVVQNHQDAEDITSEVFLRIWKASGTYHPGGPHKAWLAAIARNMAVDHLRSHHREIPDDPQESLLLETEPLPDTTEEIVENLSIQAALSTLSPPEREVVHLKVIGELTFREISSLLNVPMGTVTWRYRQAIQKLRRCGYEA